MGVASEVMSASGGYGTLDLDDASSVAEEARQQRLPRALDGVADDFSLPSPGLRLRPAGKGMIIYEQPQGQWILEEFVAPTGEERAPRDDEGGEDGILVKAIDDGTYAFTFLRVIYSLMATFVGGFLFVTGLVILIYLFMDAATSLGLTSGNGGMKENEFIPVILSMPIFVYGLAWMMTLVVRFVVDTFNGRPLLRSFGLGALATDWIAFVLFIGIPVLTIVVTLFLKIGNWWEISLLTWFICVLACYFLFSACVLWLEVKAFLELVEDEEDDSSIRGKPWADKAGYWLNKAWEGCVRTARYRLSGSRFEMKKMDASGNATTSTKEGCPSFFTEDMLGGCFQSCVPNKWNPCYVQDEQARRIYTLDETLGTTSYATRYSWGLETLFCRSGGLFSAIPITQGDASITRRQIDSSIVCNILGNILIGLLFVGAVVWFRVPPAVLGIATFLFVVFLIYVGFDTRRLFRLRKDISNNQDPVLYKYWERYRHSTPKDAFVCTALLAQVSLLYLWPLIYLCIKNAPSAWLFALLGFFAALRHFMNPRIILLESKGNDYFRSTFNARSMEEREVWKKKTRLYHLVAISDDTARHFWTYTYILFSFFLAILAISAANGQAESSSMAKDPATLVNSFEYHTQPELHYPSCVLKKGFGGNYLQIQDFAFLSKLAYMNDDLVEDTLQSWFPQGVATNNVSTIEAFKRSQHYTEEYGFGSAVEYKLIHFPTLNGAALAIRGTQTLWDLMADAQLWITAMLLQGLRSVLPVAGLWTPILHHLVWMISKLETDSLEKVSYYRETTGFVEFLKKKGLLLAVTGHSLGGGIAIITGAQTDTSAVAISGPNAMLSRKSFDPPLTVEDLNTHTFNIVPARDPVPMFDDKARLYQNINCTAPDNNIFGCHDVTRTTCELQFTCGSANRPVLCECALDFGYPEPSEKANGQMDGSSTITKKTFIQECVERCQASATPQKCDRWKRKMEETARKELVQTMHGSPSLVSEKK